jgi:hypothetical protein
LHKLMTTQAALAALACALAVGCGDSSGDGGEEGTVTVTDTDGQPTEGGSDSTPTEGGEQGSETGDEGGMVSCEDGAVPGQSPRLVRLSHRQYDNTIRDLLLLPADAKPSSQFLSDPPVAGFDNNAAALVVKDRLGRDYRRAAESLAEQVTAPDKLATLLPCQPEGDGSACASQFIAQFGRRTFRRALTASELASYNGFYAQGAGLYDVGTSFEQGVRFVVEAMLQSPHFLYRIELSDTIESGVKIPLTGHEVATRLSYMLWNSGPDDLLLTAADNGELTTAAGVEAQARRLLADPRSEDPVRDFHAQWLDLRKLSNLQKNTDVFPNYKPEMAGAMAEETQRFIRQVIFELNGDYEALMTAPFTYVNADLASIYKLDGIGPEFQEVTLDPLQRGGLLTQPSMLATHAFPHLSSPIHRGAFMQSQILCNPPPPPPGDADLNLPPVEGEIKTTRQQVEAHTESKEYCAGCHKAIINPPGFAFEHYDALGQWRDLENGEVIDSASSFFGKYGTEFVFTDAIDMIGQIAVSQDGQRCYLTQWFRYGFARGEQPVDRCTLDELHVALTGEGYNIQELLVALTTTTAFRYRAVEEGP